jgi:hypothetical protein
LIDDSLYQPTTVEFGAMLGLALLTILLLVWNAW